LSSKATQAAGDSLVEYRRKRDFKKTAEPRGAAKKRSGNSFVVQKHAATRLHYDFRLELDGVLKSWAVTRGPSVDPAQKRLAVRTEDHPLEYGGFEGTIAKGEYGGGTVMLWDSGTWEPVEDPHEGLKDGKLKFRLSGKRLKGGWALVRMRAREKEKRENWLLIKERDEMADERDPILDANTTSAETGRSMQQIADGKSAVWRSSRKSSEKPATSPRPSKKPGASARKSTSRAKAAPLPEFRPPQLTTLVDEAPAGDDWVHELKYDGYRLLIAASGDEFRCYTRSGQDWTNKFSAIANAFRAMDLPGVLIDGEAVAYNEKGRSDFSSLQHALSEGGPIEFYAFDLLEESGEDLTGRPLIERKRRLEALMAGFPKKGPIHFSTHIEGRGEEVFARICKAGEEGIVSKKATSRYVGDRTKTWLKVKCTKRQEFVIGGWTPSDKRTGFRSLLLGVFEKSTLRYVGQVGTGFDEKALEELSARFKKLARKNSPFDNVPRDVARKAEWIEPKLIAEIAFTEFTRDGILRHPSFQGLREDRKARSVMLERPQPVEKAMGKDAKEIVKAGVRITHPGRVVFPGQGLTKNDLAEYYEAVGELMLPHLVKRPLSLVRCPSGADHKCFFQKHDTGGFPDAMKHVLIEESSGAKEQYFYVTDLAGIISGVQMNVLEFHVWGCRVDQVEKPDRIVFDLDPDIGLDFDDVRRAALDLRDRLADLGLKTFPMLSGGKGIHVIAPLARRAGWAEVKAFCKGFAVRLEEDAPERYVANMAKAKRKGRIFVDYLRNERGSTAITPYSTRSRDKAPVAAPISWSEVKSIAGANVFTVENLAERVGKVGDPWPGYFDVGQSITAKLLKAVNAK
jgi:bifunctional non-homologous end joining protein LigD